MAFKPQQVAVFAETSCSPSSGTVHSDNIYVLSAYPQIRELNVDFKDLQMLEFIRNLSNISQYMRKELGSVFWGKTHLECLNDMRTLRAFLEQQPATHRGIKRLKLLFELLSKYYKFKK